MRTGWILLTAAFLALLPGCKAPDEGAGKAAAAKAPAGDKDRVYLTVDFEQGRTLRYRFISRREITLDWDPGSTATKNRVQEHAEHLEMVVAYTPVEVDPYGAQHDPGDGGIRSGHAQRRADRAQRPGSTRSKRAGQELHDQGRSAGPDCRCRPVEGLDSGDGREGVSIGRPGGRTKEPDMIGDFVAGQWFLWDALATIPLPAEGLAIGQTWQSQLPVPTPMVMRQARDVTYRYNGVRAGPRGSAAVIESTYALAKSAPADWPVPYAGRFRMSGTFGFLGPYEVLALEGSGEELYNIEAGRLGAAAEVRDAGEGLAAPDGRSGPARRLRSSRC